MVSVIDLPDNYTFGNNPLETYDIHTVVPIAANSWANRNGLVFNLPIGILRRVLIYVTPGCQNRVRTNLFQGTTQILPFTNLAPFAYNDFTEVDALGRLTLTSIAGLNITFTGMLATDTSYLYKDYATGSFDSWEVRADVKITAAVAGSRVHVLSFWNSIGPMAGAGSTSHLSAYLTYDGANYKIYLNYITAGGATVASSVNVALGTDYYLKLWHTAGSTVVHLDIYYGPDYATMFASFTITHAELATNYYRYFYPIQSYSGGAANAMSGYVKGLWLNSPSITYLTGEDYWFDTRENFFQYITASTNQFTINLWNIGAVSADVYYDHPFDYYLFVERVTVP